MAQARVPTINKVSFGFYFLFLAEEVEKEVEENREVKTKSNLNGRRNEERRED